MFDLDFLKDLENFLDQRADINDQGGPNEAMRLLQQFTVFRGCIEAKAALSSYHNYQKIHPMPPNRKELYLDAYHAGRISMALKFFPAAKIVSAYTGDPDTKNELAIRPDNLTGLQANDVLYGYIRD